MFYELSNFIQTLKYITPAELLFLYKQKESATTDLVRVSLIDLYVRRIVDFNFMKELLNDSPHAYHTLKALKSDNCDNLKPHECRIIKTINSYEKDISLTRFSKTLLPNLSSRKAFYFNDIYIGLVKQGLFGRTPIFEQMGYFRKIGKGRELAKFMNKFIPFCEGNIDDWIENDPQKLVDLLNKIDTHVLVSDNFYLFWKALDFFVSLPDRRNNRYLNGLSSNNVGEYIRYHCSGNPSVVDIRGIGWEWDGLSSG